MALPLRRVDHVRWELPVDYKRGMRVPGLIFADSYVLETIEEEKAYEQVANVAFLPGIQRYSFAMPDIHWGYGFPIGGVAAFDVDEGVVSPGGVGYDISCGVRLMALSLTEEEVRKHLDKLAARLFSAVPSGVGSSGALELSFKELDEVLEEGAKWAVRRGFGTREDLKYIEEGGSLRGADPDKVSRTAKERGREQMGTLGSGNHFLEIQAVEEVYDEAIASRVGLGLGRVAVMVHCGSRGLGHQVCDDYIKVMMRAMRKYGISVPDRQLCCAPVRSDEGRDYLSAMRAAANFALANRQVIGHWVRRALEEVLGQSVEIRLVYDVSHNMAHVERHELDGVWKELCVHRKGATRALPPGHEGLPQEYREIGQPVIIPGSMGTPSYLLVGTKGAAETFYSTCHGSGRVMSRKQAVSSTRNKDVIEELGKKGVKVMVKSRETLHEEVPEAYKDIDRVVEVVQKAGISRKLVKLRPICVIKG